MRKSFFKVAFTPMSGAKRSVIATDDMLYGDDGMGRPLNSSRVNPRRSPSTLTQLR
jgi:hypothetical protein